MQLPAYSYSLITEGCFYAIRLPTHTHPQIAENKNHLSWNQQYLEQVSKWT